MNKKLKKNNNNDIKKKNYTPQGQDEYSPFYVFLIKYIPPLKSRRVLSLIQFPPRRLRFL